jgi:CheY-like chemotaxis protein
MRDPITVLFVDDDPAVLRMIRRTLIGRPFDVVVAEGGREALGILEARRIDVIVSDLDMPEMDGLELLRLARRTSPGALRMVLSGALSPDRMLDVVNGCDVVRLFPKMFEPERFCAALAELDERIEQGRRESAEAARAAARVELRRRIEARFPGTLSAARDDDGRVRVDGAARRAAALAAGSAAASLLLPAGGR